MNSEKLKKLNDVADIIIKNEKADPIDFELLLQMLKKMIYTKRIKKPRHRVELLLSREETLKSVLNFYKSIDNEYYSDALDFLIQLKRNKTLHLFFDGKDKLSDIEQTVLKTGGRNEYEHILNQEDIYVPMRLEEKKEEENINNRKTDVIGDIIRIVHEIAHHFDRSKVKGIFSIEADINKIDFQRKNEVWQIINKENKLQNIFTETTSITFENLYMQYLMEMPDCSKSTISFWAIDRFNDCLINAHKCYDALIIAKMKKENKTIRNENLVLLAQEYGLSVKMIEQRLEEIIRLNGDINSLKKYAIGGLLAPTIIYQYQNNGVDVLKDYIEAVKNNSLDDIFKVLNIQKNEAGISILVENMKKHIEPYCLFSEEKSPILEI